MSMETYRETLATFLDSPVDVPAAQNTSDLLEQIGVVVNLLAARVVALEKTEAAREKREKLHNAERIDAEYDISKRLDALETTTLKDGGVWKPDKAFTPRDMVTYRGKQWVCLRANTNVRPGTSDDWRLTEKYQR